MYTITGASGQLGRLVLKQLMAKVPAEIIATTRGPEKLKDVAALGVVVRGADFSEPLTVVARAGGIKPESIDSPVLELATGRDNQS